MCLAWSVEHGCLLAFPPELLAQPAKAHVLSYVRLLHSVGWLAAQGKRGPEQGERQVVVHLPNPRMWAEVGPHLLQVDSGA